MDAYNLIKNRRTIHHYEHGQLVPMEEINKAIELSLYAPNHRLTFPQRYYLIDSLEIKNRLFEYSMEEKRKKNASLTPDLIVKAKRKFFGPSKMIVLSQKINENEVIGKEDYATCAMAIQNISLYLWDKNIGTKWSTSSFLNNPGVYHCLEIDPNLEKIIGVLWVGKFGELKGVPPRPNVSEHFKIIK